MAVRAEWILNKAKEKIYAISHAKAVVRNNSTVDADLTTLENTVKKLQEGVNTNVSVRDIVIPNTGWVKSTDFDDGEERMSVDIEQSDITENMVPIITIVEPGFETQECGMYPTARTVNGAVRVYAKTAPKRRISAQLILFLSSGEGIKDTNPGGTVSLQPAGRDTLGAVKIGDGLNIDKDGTISIDYASTQEIQDTINKVFRNEDASN